MTAILESREPGHLLVGPRPVDFQQTVPRHLVHRAAVSEVFITDMRETGENHFTLGAQWPRRHSFLGPRTKTSHDPMLYAETTRQATLVLAHRAFEIPLTSSFLSANKKWAVIPAGLGVSDRPVDIVLTARAHDIRPPRKGSARMRLEFECFRDGVQIGTATESWSCVPPATYKRVRGDRFASTPFEAGTPVSTVEPGRVGRERPGDVLVTETERDNVWALQFDPDHPVLFDHPVDHVPGMVLMEGARQAALLLLADPEALPLRADYNFTKYVEFAEPCLIIVDERASTAAGVRVVHVTFEQNGRPVATGTLDMSSQ
jgi:hypothetical protein